MKKALYRDQHDAFGKTSWPNLNLHLYAMAMEQIELGNTSLLDENWPGAKACYEAALRMLEQVPSVDKRNLKNCYSWLVYVHLRLFEFAEAWRCFAKLYGKRPDSYRATEADAVLESIKAARKGSIDDISSRDYTPGFFTGQL